MTEQREAPQSSGEAPEIPEEITYHVLSNARRYTHAAKGFPKWAKETCEEPEFAEALHGLTAATLPVSMCLCVVDRSEEAPHA